MSDHYFACARRSNCIGRKEDMSGFHKCAISNNCKKPKKKKVKAPAPGLEALASAAGVTGSGRKGRHNPWVAHVKKYQRSHGCSYQEAMVRAKQSYKVKGRGHGYPAGHPRAPRTPPRGGGLGDMMRQANIGSTLAKMVGNVARSKDPIASIKAYYPTAKLLLKQL